MLPGFAGHLVSEHFVESVVTDAAPDLMGSAATAARARLSRWRRGCEWLGPASSVKTLFEAAAVPLVEALGFEPPARGERMHACLVGSIRAGREPLVLVVTAWSERLDPLWRPAIAESIHRAAG